MMDPISCDDLDVAIQRYTNDLGYRLDMIKPADAPREAILSKGGEMVTLVSASGVLNSFGVPTLVGSSPITEPAEFGTQNDWVIGRAGMEYRDLIPGRMGGKVIASHIRIIEGGEVPDYVHYHKIEFQMIYCKRGRIRVVYEDQGPPFWLETGDCVLQPPEIRHRVLESTAGAEVVELSMPAEHDTWVEHDITLPTVEVKPDHEFGGQRFVRHIAAKAPRRASNVAGFDVRETGIASATNGLASVTVLEPSRDVNEGPIADHAAGRFIFPLDGSELLVVEIKGPQRRNHVCPYNTELL